MEVPKSILAVSVSEIAGFYKLQGRLQSSSFPRHPRMGRLERIMKKELDKWGELNLLLDSGGNLIC